MYRHTSKNQNNYGKTYSKVNTASAQCELGDAAVQRIPELLSAIEITDYNNGVPTTHVRVIQDRT